MARREEICMSCENGLRAKKDNLCNIIGRHKEWAVNRLLRIDERLDLLKVKVKGFDKEITKLENQKFALFKRLRFTSKNWEVKK